MVAAYSSAQCIIYDLETAAPVVSFDSAKTYSKLILCFSFTTSLLLVQHSRMLEGLGNHLAWDRIVCEQALLFGRAKRAARGCEKAPHFRMLLARLLFTIGDVCTQANNHYSRGNRQTAPDDDQQETVKTLCSTIKKSFKRLSWDKRQTELIILK